MTKEYWMGPDAAHRRVIYKGAGYSDQDIRNKPHVGIANTFSEASPAHAHLRMLAEAVKQGVWAAGGVPFEFGVPATCGNIAIGSEELKYELAGRDAVAMAIEFVAKVHHFDGLVMLSSCDNIIPGQLLAAARINVPSILVTGGPMLPGLWKDKKVLTPDINVAVFGEVTPGEFSEMEDAACPGFGACAVMGTANTMQILTEALGMALPGTSTIPAVDAGRIRAARESGHAVVELIKKGITPRDIITKGALSNATAVDLAVGGSTNAVLHILSLARELGEPFGLDDFDRISREIPCICAVKPNGPYNVVDFHQAGGVPAVQKLLAERLDLAAVNVSGSNLKEVLSGITLQTGDVMKSLDDSADQDSGLTVLKGNLAPNGAIIRSSGVPENMKYFSGPAKVFNGDAAALEAVQNGDIKPGDVMVVIFEGPKGSPGMKELMLSTDALVARGLDHSVGLITDGRFSGFNHGPIVGHISPEAFEGGPVALVQDGDIITVDIRQRRVDVQLSEEEIAKRKAVWKRPESKETRGMLALYAATCRPADEGAAMQTW